MSVYWSDQLCCIYGYVPVSIIDWLGGVLFFCQPDDFPCSIKQKVISRQPVNVVGPVFPVKLAGDVSKGSRRQHTCQVFAKRL